MTQMILITSLMVDHEAFDCVYIYCFLSFVVLLLHLCESCLSNFVNFTMNLCNGHARKGVGLVEPTRWLQDIASSILIFIL